ncbi:MAG TPA: hypothetical protein DEB31_03825 [Clostridiales bacterium]|nr:hypothetical protein [Clostridiales bacterium]
MNRIYEILKNTAGFAGKLKLDEAKNRLMIVFHEYLCLTYIEGNYTTARDEGLIRLNDDVTHWHIQEDEEAMEIVTTIAGGDLVFLEKHLVWRNTELKLMDRLKLMDKEKFEKKKERYMRKKSLRIYTGTEIIKRDG